MSDLHDAVEQFLDEADAVYGEYEKGYVNPDVALSRLESHVETLREQVE